MLNNYNYIYSKAVAFIGNNKSITRRVAYTCEIIRIVSAL